jgi:hypothetical protein
VTFGYPIIKEMERLLAGCFPDTALISFSYSVSSSGSAQFRGVGESTRSSPFLGTNRAPRTFTDGRISSAIQRLTVLSERPVKSVMSLARRYAGASVMSDRPVEVGLSCQAASMSRGQSRGQPDAPAAARAL